MKHLFEHKGVIETKAENAANLDVIVEKATEHAIEAGAEDVRLEGETLQFICDPKAFMSVQNNLEQLGYKITYSNVDFVPIKLQSLTENEIDTCAVLYEKLEKIPEVVKLYDNIA